MKSTMVEYPAGQRGMSMIELMVASFIAVVFMLAAATGYIVNQKAYKANRVKLELQQTASHVMEIMEKNIRAAASAAITNPPDRIQLFHRDGTEYTRFSLDDSAGVVRLLAADDALLASQKLTLLEFIPNEDTTVVQINLAFEDAYRNKVEMHTSAALRNHPLMRNIDPD